VGRQAHFDPRRILEILHDHGIDYVVLGGIAATLYGSPLPTSDLDICPALDRVKRRGSRSVSSS